MVYDPEVFTLLCFFEGVSCVFLFSHNYIETGRQRIRKLHIHKQ